MLERNRQFQLQAPHILQTDFFYDGPDDSHPGDRYEATDSGFNPLYLLRYLVEYRWLIATLAMAGLMVAFVGTMMQTPIYRSTVQLEVLVPSARIFQDMEAVSETSDMRALLTAREKIRSRTLARRVASELGLVDNPAFVSPASNFAFGNILNRVFGLEKRTAVLGGTPEEREDIAISRLAEGLSVQSMPNTSLLSITFEDQDPVLAAAIADQVARSFIDLSVAQTSETSEQARQFIQGQVLQLKAKLQASEEALVRYAKDAGITVTGDERSLIAANIDRLNAALAAAIQERLDYGRLVAQIDAGQGESLENVLASEGLAKLRGRIAELSAEYQQKLAVFKPGFPDMIQLKAQIEELRRQFGSGVLAISESIRLKHQETIGKEENLQQKMAELEQQQLAFDDKNIQYTILKREVDSNRSQYDDLVAKLNEAGVNSELRTASAAIVDPAVVPSRQFSPRLSLNLGLGLIVFLAAGIAIIYIRELTDNTFTNAGQIESELGLPVLSMLPNVGERDLAGELDRPNSRLSEAYRTLRTSLLFSGPDGVPKVLLVTSAEPSEGKTTTSFKLAQDFAALGARVLVIDGDLRKPTMHRLFGLDNVKGLSNLLTNTAPRHILPALFKKTAHDELYVLTSGPIPPNPADLLSSRKMAAVVCNLAKRFDLVIIDAPPIVGLSDAPVLGRIADGTLLVVSAGQVTRKSARAALKRMRATGSQVVGVAFTKLPANGLQYDRIGEDYYGYGADSLTLIDELGEDRRVANATDGSDVLVSADRLQSSAAEVFKRIKPTA